MSRVEHGIRPMPLLEARRREAAYTVHRSNAIMARKSLNTDLARHHATEARMLVTKFARIAPFSPEAARVYLRGQR